MITVTNLSRHYGRVVAVDGVSFEIPKGQIVGLLGHNGAGKSTTMKVLTGYLEPTEGQVSIDGFDIIQERHRAQERIGYLPENSPTYPDMTVLEYLGYIADLRCMTDFRREGAIKMAVERCGLLGRLDDRIGTLSKGFRQRVGVAQAILHQPQILILDEPTSGLDPSQIIEMRHLIKELSAKATVILSTHILQEVEALCDRVIIILRGRLAKDALLADLQHSNKIQLSVNTNPEQVVSVLRQQPGIHDVQCTGSRESVHCYELRADDAGPARRAQLAKTISERGWELYSLAVQEHNLETVFREINAGRVA